MPSISELMARAPWREAVTYRDTWPHEYVLTDPQFRTIKGTFWLLSARGFWPGRESPPASGRENTYLFIGDHKYWLMTDYNDIDPYNDEGDYVLNRARLYRDRRDFLVQPGVTGKPEDYPANPPHPV